MSFQKAENSSFSKRFVSESEIAEIKRKREEEWKIAREQGREIEIEEDIIHDGRTLFERLREQKDKKQEEFEEQLKFKNMIYKGLNDEEAEFLSHVNEQQAEVHSRRFEEDSSDLLSFRLTQAAVGKLSEELSEKAAQNISTNALKTSAEKNVKGSARQRFAPNVMIRKRSSGTNIQQTKGAKNYKFDKKDDCQSAATDPEDKPSVSKETPLATLITYSDTESSDDDT